MLSTGTKVKLISASAGTGKTTRLVKEVLELLKEYPASQICAVTFTNAAVRDLREKISQEELRISTIHSFFASILKEQSIKIGISPTFSIMDDTAASKLVFEDLCLGVLSSKLNDEENKNLFSEYNIDELISIMNRLQSNYASIRHNLKLGVKDIIALEHKGEFLRLHQLTGPNFIKDVLDAIINISCSDPENGLEKDRASIVGDVTKLKSLMSDLFKDIEIQNRELLIRTSDLIGQIIIPNIGNKKSPKGWASPERVVEVRAAIKRLKNLVNEIKNLDMGSEQSAQHGAQIIFKLLSIFKEINQKYSEYKKSKEALDYNDIEVMTHDFLNSHPEVCSYYKKKYSCILVDEFQDTNSMQRDVLFRISENLFLVGDARQSIYRFRNADVRVFIDTQRNYLKGQYEELSNNYRSLPKIVEAVNDGFKIIFDDWVEVKADYNPEYMKMNCARESNGESTSEGVVQLLNVGNPDRDKTYVELEAFCTSDLILDKVKSGMDFGDFAVLFRAKTNIPVFEKIFIKNNIPYVVWGDTDKTEVIKRLKSLFSSVMNPYDEYALFETLKLPVFYVKDEVLYDIKKSELPIWKGVEKFKNFIVESDRLISSSSGFCEYVSQILKISKFIDSMAVIYPGQEQGLEEMILRLAQRVEEQGSGISEFIRLLSQVSSDKNETETPGVVRLMTVHASKGLQFPVVIMPCLHHTAPDRDLIVVSQNGDVSVKLRDKNGRDRRPTAYHAFIKADEQDAELAESKRVFYVAATRARDELYMVGNFVGSLNNAIEGEEDKAKESERWLDWASYIYSDKIKETPYSKVDESPIKARPIREIICVNDSLSTTSGLDSENFCSQRFSVSMIKDFAISPELMIQNLIQKDIEPGESSKEKVGSIIHTVLENYKDKEFVESIYKKLPNNVKDAVHKIVTDFMASDLAKNIFDAEKYFTEQSFMTKISGNVVIGRIDRLNIYDDRVWVIDYKTGINPEHMEGFKAQMACYLDFAQKAYPNKEVYGSIVDLTECTEMVYSLKDLTVPMPVL